MRGGRTTETDPVQQGDIQMYFMRINSRFIALPLAVLMLVLSMPTGVAQAALVGTDQVIQSAEADFERTRLATLLGREDVRRRMQAMGVDPDEATARLDGLSDAEVKQVAARLDTLPAGKGIAGELVAAVVLIFLVLLATDLLGLTDVFPFVKGGKGK